MIPKLIAKFTNSLALGVETSSTEMLLSSTVSRDNQTIPSGTYGFVINRGQENEEFCIGSYVAGTVTFTARGLSYLDGITEISANKKKHRKGDPVEMTTHPALTYIAKMLAGDIDLDGILKYPASRLINNQRQLVDKEYADSIVSSQITSLKVSADGALTVAVNSGYYSLNGVITYYAGSVGNALADDAVNYIQMNDGVLNINSVGFTEGAMPLAKITTASGAITIEEDARAVLGWLDVKTNSGIGRDSSGLFIDLATDPGLEFSEDGLKVKIKADGGLIKDGDGLSIANPLETLPAYENLSAGDFLKAYNDNGTVKLKKIVGMGNTHTNFIELNTNGHLDIKAVFLSDSLVVFIYPKYGNFFYVRAASINGKTMTLGSEVALTDTNISNGTTLRFFEVAKINDTSFVVSILRDNGGAIELSAHACSVSGTTITQGTKLSLYSFSYRGAKSLSMCEIESGKFLIAFVAAYTSTPYLTRRAVVITVSGTTVSAGATLTLQDNTDNSGFLSVAKFNTNKAYLVYGYGSSSTRYVYGRVLTISGTTITAGSENTHHSTTNGDVSGIRLIRHSDNNLLFSWVINTTYEPNFGKLVFSGDTPTYTKISTDIITEGQIVYRDGRLYTRGFTYFIDLAKSGLSLLATINTTLFPAVNGFSMFDLSPSGLPVRTGNNSYLSSYYYFDPVLGDYDHADFITSANSSYSAGDNVPITDVFTGFSSLVAGIDYYINAAASGLTISSTYQKVGKAISSTKIIK